MGPLIHAILCGLQWKANRRSPQNFINPSLTILGSASHPECGGTGQGRAGSRKEGSAA